MAFFKSIWKANSKHKKLSEELALQNNKENEEAEQNEKIEHENDVLTFKLKYLGSTRVDSNFGDNTTSEAVKSIIKMAKSGKKKLQRAHIAVSLKGIAVTDLEGNDLFKISIYRISNCSTDSTHKQVFSFISTDEHETAECHAFICPKRKMAESVTLAIAHAFRGAYEEWRVLPTNQKTIEKFADIDNAKPIVMVEQKNEANKAPIKQDGAEFEVKLIDFDDDEHESGGSGDDFSFYFDQTPNSFSNDWVCFDDDFVSPQQQSFKNDLVMA